jgi:hypothetical protein
MFYFLLAPTLNYNVILIAAAVLPAPVPDGPGLPVGPLEKESPQLLLRPW